MWLRRPSAWRRAGAVGNADTIGQPSQGGGPVSHVVPIRAAAVPAWLRLQAELSDADSVPCRGQNSRLWTSEQPEERAAAAYRCAPCPAIASCGDYAEVARERFGVWAGRDRTKTNRAVTNRKDNPK